MSTILVVDDEVSIAQLLDEMLTDEGYQVICVGNGSDALARMRVSRPDGVLCDLMMPGMDGRELCREMHADPDLRSIPIVLMTAVPDHSALNDCEYSALLRKPFHIDDMLGTLARVIQGKD